MNDNNNVTYAREFYNNNINFVRVYTVYTYGKSRKLFFTFLLYERPNRFTENFHR